MHDGRARTPLGAEGFTKAQLAWGAACATPDVVQTSPSAHPRRPREYSYTQPVASHVRRSVQVTARVHCIARDVLGGPDPEGAAQPLDVEGEEPRGEDEDDEANDASCGHQWRSARRATLVQRASRLDDEGQRYLAETAPLLRAAERIAHDELTRDARRRSPHPPPLNELRRSTALRIP